MLLVDTTEDDWRRHNDWPCSGDELAPIMRISLPIGSATGDVVAVSLLAGVVVVVAVEMVVTELVEATAALAAPE